MIWDEKYRYICFIFLHILRAVLLLLPSSLSITGGISIHLFIMLFYSTAVALSLLYSQAIAISPRDEAASFSNLNSFISSERKTALQGVLNNIGPDGSKVSGAGNYVVASPSKANPDCTSNYFSSPRQSV